MTENLTETLRLPVLSLADEVVLPGMVVPVELDDAARAAIDAARAGADDTLLLAPRLGDRYPTYGVVATIEQIGRLPGGAPAAVLRAEARARIGNGVTGPGAALWVEAELVSNPEVTEDIQHLAGEYQALVVAVLERRNAWQIIDSVKQITDPSTLADTAGWAPYLSIEQKRQLLETPDVEQRLRDLIEWTREHLAEVEVTDKIRDDVRDGMEKSQREFLLRQQLAAIRKELGEGEPEGADDYRARVEAAELPEKVREAALREVGKLERASDQSPESGLDPHLARHRPRTALDEPHDRPHRRERGPRGARRRPPRPGRRQGPHRRVPGRPGPAGRRAASRSSAAGAPAPCWPSPARPESARRRSARASRGPSTASSCGSPWVACATRPRSAATAVRTSGRCPVGSSGRSPRPGR